MKQKTIKAGASVKYVDKRAARANKFEHSAKVLKVNSDGSLSLLVNFKTVGKIPFDRVMPLVGNDVEGWR